MIQKDKQDIEQFFQSRLGNTFVVEGSSSWEDIKNKREKSSFFRFNLNKMNIYYVGIIISIAVIVFILDKNDEVIIDKVDKKEIIAAPDSQVIIKEVIVPDNKDNVLPSENKIIKQISKISDPQLPVSEHNEIKNISTINENKSEISEKGDTVITRTPTIIKKEIVVVKQQKIVIKDTVEHKVKKRIRKKD